MRHRTLWIFVLCAALVGAQPLAPSTGAIILASDYPSLSTEEMGHIRHMINLANQLDGDWSLMGNTPGGDNFDAYQFQIAFAAYALSLAQYHKVPAHRDLYRDASSRLIEKMIYKDVWQYWAAMSQYEKRGADQDGNSSVYREDGWQGWIDPNIKSNIMYSGHLLQMVSLHESLFDDHRYDEPGSLPFVFPAIEYGGEPLRMDYDHERLATVIYDQFVASDFLGIECELGAIYTECNQHPILGLIQYDQTHGTDYSAEVEQEFAETIREREFISPENHTTMFYLHVRSDEVIPASTKWSSIGMAWSDGWNGQAHHVWAPQYVKDLYREQVKLYIPGMFEGDPGSDMGWTSSFDFGWFAVLAAEVGDMRTVATMLDYADEHFGPTWRDGGLYYPHTPDYRENFNRDENGFIHNISPVTGNVLVAMTRLNPGDGLWTLYNEPREEKHFAEPFVSDVEYIEANVTQAIYDRDKAALIVTLAPGPVASDSTTFTVNQLDPSISYTIHKDGAQMGVVHSGSGSGVAGVTWNANGALTISTELDGVHSFVVAANQ